MNPHQRAREYAEIAEGLLESNDQWDRMRALALSLLAVYHVVKPMMCRECGCTDLYPCFDELGDPCSWVEPELCSKCAEKAKVVYPPKG